MEEYNCKYGSCIFKYATILFALEIIFITITSFVFIKDYYANVKKTFNTTVPMSYIVKNDFMILYKWASFSTIIFVLYIVFIICWLIINYIC